MSLNSVPKAERVHIGIFGRRNSGKSSLINAITGQMVAIVSDVKGTTTDPVSKTMELLPLGPVVITDTPGADDDGELGKMRVQKAYQALDKTDIAILVIDCVQGKTTTDEDILTAIKAKQIPYITVFNKSDRISGKLQISENEMLISAKTMENIDELKERLSKLALNDKNSIPLISDKVCKGDIVVLVVPIDAAAPKSRLILPQQQTIRELLEAGAVSVVCREHELKQTLSVLRKKPKAVITDSQVFKAVSDIVPSDVELTSFSILFARKKGDLAEVVKGAAALHRLCDGDKILISEGCTHRRQCGDIGTCKLPALLKRYTGKKLDFHYTSGIDFMSASESFDLIIHCGGCMLNEREMKHRIKCAQDRRIPITNYGIAIAYMNGILERSIRLFPEIGL